MVVIKAPQYIADSFEEDCRRLGIPEDFVVEVFTYREKREIGSRGGFCKPISVDGKKRVVIGIREEGTQGRTLGNFRHTIKHAQQIFTGNRSEFPYDEIAAYAYEVRRGLEDKFSWIYRKIIAELTL